MYSAVRDQLVAPNRTGMSVDELRRKTAEYIRQHKDDFLPFMTSKHTGDMLTSGNRMLYFFSFFGN